jgi:hypothetical protein
LTQKLVHSHPPSISPVETLPSFCEHQQRVEEQQQHLTMTASEKKRSKEPSQSIPTPQKPPEKKGRSPGDTTVLSLGQTIRNLSKTTQGRGRGHECGGRGRGGRGSGGRGEAAIRDQTRNRGSGQQTLDIWKKVQQGGSRVSKKDETKKARDSCVVTAFR